MYLHLGARRDDRPAGSHLLALASRLQLSTYLRHLRFHVSCKNKAEHSAAAPIHGKDGVAGSIPAGGSTHSLTSGNAGESPSGAVGADHIRIGMGCEGSARCQSANSLTDQQLWPWSIYYRSMLDWSHGGT